MSVKRVIFYILAVLICFLLQTAVFEFFSLADVVPNVLLILTVTMGFIRGRKTGIVIGFVCGLLIDIYSGEVLGQYAVLYRISCTRINCVSVFLVVFYIEISVIARCCYCDVADHQNFLNFTVDVQ